VKIELHPDAAKNFDEKGIELLSDVRPYIERPRVAPDQPHGNQNNIGQPASRKGFSSEVFISQTFTAKDIIGPMRFGLIDGATGKAVAAFFLYDGVKKGLEGEAYKKLVKLSESIQKTKELNEHVSIEFLNNKIFSWVEQAYKRNTDLYLTKYVLEGCAEAIKEIEIWIPVALLHIESEHSSQLCCADAFSVNIAMIRAMG
jgi:hypothetical protein